MQDAITEALTVDRGSFEPQPARDPFVAMQRVVVRMLFDPAFAERVYKAPDDALAGLPTDAALTAQLLDNDPRLWNADRLRRSRALKILLEEYKVSATLALHACRRLAFLDAFFTSSWFHDAVQLRGYMALAFGGYLRQAAERGEVDSPHLRATLEMEHATAVARRKLRDARRGLDEGLSPVAPGRPRPRLAAKPGVRGVLVPAGTIATVQHVEKYLFEVTQVPALVLCDDPPSLDPLPALSPTAVAAFLLEPQEGGHVSIAEIDPLFVHLVNACQRPTTLEGIALALAPHGVTPDEASELAQQLLDGEVLRVVQVDADGAVVDPSSPEPQPEPRPSPSAAPPQRKRKRKR